MKQFFLNMNDYIPVVGLEIHVELKTKSKMFCQCEADYFGKAANTNTCPVCLGMPGGLPVPNKKAVEWTILIGKALNCEIKLVSKFDRKHYFYPDLAKGYQISQYDEPIAVKGHLKIGEKIFGITRVHLEEDTGKLMHSEGDTLVDFNRSGVPLVEIVTEPDFDNSDDVKKFLEELHAIIETLNVSDADMEKGSMRLEPNISVKKKGEKELPNYKVEVKNINSFNFVKRAIDYEVARHIELLEVGKTPPQETRGYVEKTSSTVSQRSKEEAHDYRYFPEPDIPPLLFKQEYIDSIKVPQLPLQLETKLIEVDKLNNSSAFLMAHSSNATLTAYQGTVSALKKDETLMNLPNLNQGTANYILNKIPEEQRTNLSYVIDLTRSALKPKETNMNSLTDIIDKVIKTNEKVVADYKSGKQNAVMFLVGQVMKEMKGQADANTVKLELVKKLAV